MTHQARRSAALTFIVIAALAGAGVAVAALMGAFSSSLGTYGAVFVVHGDGTDLTRLTHDDRFHDYAWSPDGRWIAVSTRSVDSHGIDVPGPLELIEASTGRSHDVGLADFVSDLAWRSKTSVELVLTGTHLKVADTHIAVVTLTGHVIGGSSIGPIGAAAWSPDGSLLAIVPCDREHARSSVDLLSPSGLLIRRLAPVSGALPEGVCRDPAATGDLVWAPDGRTLYVGLSNGLWRLPRTGASPRRITREEPLEPVVSPDGRQVVVGLSRTKGGDTGELLYLVTAEGGRARLLTPEFASTPAWSPDGSRIAFVPRTGETIRTIPSSGGPTRPLTRFPGEQSAVCCLSWSPTGHQLAFNASAKPPED